MVCPAGVRQSWFSIATRTRWRMPRPSRLNPSGWSMGGRSKPGLAEILIPRGPDSADFRAGYGVFIGLELFSRVSVGGSEMSRVSAARAFQGRKSGGRMMEFAPCGGAEFEPYNYSITCIQLFTSASWRCHGMLAKSGARVGRRENFVSAFQPAVLKPIEGEDTYTA